MDFHHPFAALSHLAAVPFLLLAGLVLLARARRHSAFRRFALAAYTASAVFLYTASGLFHAVRHDTDAGYHLFRRLDLSGIFLLVAGSHLPVFAYLLAGRWRTAFTTTTLSLALAGIAAVWLFPSAGSAVMVPTYAAVALVGLLPLPLYVRAGGWRVLWWLLAVVAVYATGGACEVLRWPTLLPDVIGPHELLHLTDLAGTLLHLGLVANLVAAPRVEERRNGGSPPAPAR